MPERRVGSDAPGHLADTHRACSCGWSGYHSESSNGYCPECSTRIWMQAYY